MENGEDGEIERQEQGSGGGSPQLSHHAAITVSFVTLIHDINITIANLASNFFDKKCYLQNSPEMLEDVYQRQFFRVPHDMNSKQIRFRILQIWVCQKYIFIESKLFSLISRQFVACGLEFEVL